MTPFSELDSAAVNVLRRLLRGERVDTAPFRAVATLNDSRDQLLRGGFVIEDGKSFAITARGKAVAPAIAEADAYQARLSAERKLLAEQAERVRSAAPALLTALQALVAAATDADLNSEDDMICAAAFERQDDAVKVARDAIKLAAVAA